MRCESPSKKCFSTFCRLAILPAKGVHRQVKAVTGVAWITTLLVCCIVPIDVYSTLASRNPEGIEILWDISYWSTQLLTWILIPLYIGYASAGEFTWRGRMLASLKASGLFYLCMVCLSLVDHLLFVPCVFVSQFVPLCVCCQALFSCTFIHRDLFLEA
jgi:hypothetical protein